MRSKDYSRESQIKQQLIAQNLSGLFELLQELKGQTVDNTYSLCCLYAVGGQSILYVASTPSRRKVVVKLPFLPYHRVAYVSSGDIVKARRHLEREAALLQRFQNTVLPKFHELVYANNPLLSPARGIEIVDRETYLVMEFVEGATLRDVARIIHHSTTPDYQLLEWLAWEVASTIASFSSMIASAKEPYLYSDLNPTNLMLTCDVRTPVRILDAGSLIPFHPDQALSPPFTWSYVPPEHYEAYDRGKIIWPDPKSVMYALGKTLWEISTDRRSFPGEDPDLSDPTLKNLSRSLDDLLHRLIERRYDSFEQLKRDVDRRFPKEQIAQHQLETLLAPPEQAPAISSKPEPGAPGLATLTENILLVESLSLQTDEIRRVRYSPDGDHIAVVTLNKIELRDARSLEMVRQFLETKEKTVIGIDFDATSRLLASTSGKEVKIWNTSTGEIVWQYKDKYKIYDVAIGEGGEYLAALKDWCVVRLHPRRMSSEGNEFAGVMKICNGLALAERRQLLAVSGHGGIRLWDLRARPADAEIKRFRFTDLTWGVAISDDERRLATLVSDYQISRCSVVVVNLATLEQMQRIDVPLAQSTFVKLALEPKGELVSVGSSSGHLWLLDLEQGSVRASLTNCGRIISLDFSPNGRKLCVATRDGEVKIFRLDYEGEQH